MTRTSLLTSAALLLSCPSHTSAKIRMDENDVVRRLDRRQLQELDQDSAVCYSTQDPRKPNRYCSFDNTPIDGSFLQLSCPDSRGEDLSQCYCNIGVGEPAQAPDTVTCDKCTFCEDGSLAYDCRNVAEGTCIGRTCSGDCVSSFEEPSSLSGAFREEVGLAASVVSVFVVVLFL